MDGLVNLASLSFVLTVGGFLVQVFDVFPKYRELRKMILFVMFGFFAGSLLASLTGVTVSIGSGGLLVPLALGACLVSLGFLLAAVVTGDKKKRDELYNISGVGLMLFLGFLTVHGLVSMEAFEEELSFGERLAISRYDVATGEIDRAIKQLEWAKGWLPRDDPRAGALKAQIAALKKLQLQKQLDDIDANEATAANPRP